MFSLVLALLLATTPDSGPAGALERLRLAYEHKSDVEFAALLTADYSFHTSDQRLADYMTGWSRDKEILSAHGLFHGVRSASGELRPPADSIRIVMEGLEDGPDPEHADSTGQYRVVAIRGYQMIAHMPDGKQYATTPGLHVFHLVRGDVAVRAEGQPADSSRWYIRRWLENVNEVVAALNGEKGDCENPGPQPAQPAADEGPAAGAPRLLAIHPLGNPACPALSIQCDLPAAGEARVEVYDVTGRRVNQRDVTIPHAGTMSIEAGAGAHIAPGVYWVRLTQAARHPAVKMMVVAR